MEEKNGIFIEDTEVNRIKVIIKTGENLRMGLPEQNTP